MSRRYNGNQGRGNDIKNKANNRQDTRNNPEEKKQKDWKQGLVPQLPVLHYGATTNFIGFKKAIVPYCETRCGLLAKFFHTNQYFDIPEPVIDPRALTPRNYPFGFEREKIKNQYKENARMQQEFLNNKTAKFALIWGQLSESSIQIITQHANFTPQLA
jgi:hypothetical protein